MNLKRGVVIYPMILIYALFFMWGFVWNLFNVLATFFQETFSLSNLQTSLGTSLSFLAFFLMAYPAKVLINRIGTQKAISLGALLSAVGLIIFYPAASFQSYNGFLLGLFIIFSGVTILQTVCNPYIGILGAPETREARINFAQGIGAIGAALTAPLGGWFILELYEGNIFGGIKFFYILVALVFLVLAVLVHTAQMPENKTETRGTNLLESLKIQGAFKYRHFVIGFIIMFSYMGAEAILYQLMTPYFKEIGKIGSTEAVKLSAIIFYGLMLGRFLGAWIMTKIDPTKILGFFALIAALLVTISMLSSGKTGIYSIVAIGFFVSIMFASIFALATKDLGKFTNEASSFIIMAISGGFFIPLLYGLVADFFSLRASLIVVIIPLVGTSLYGFFYNNIKRK
ncbi:MFS transporter [Carboxylicivirga sediminis]|uniref:MFS transporter n=1 Tax=Carboxylicivirga sediminis TaxID=2006564 RepID=A0A941IYI7_9BACT|nr:MFS transporter [Carboxylicivirga sediminis]MBR8535842.1 MFS transporter [Carboxylicivirga sediminis]